MEASQRWMAEEEAWQDSTNTTEYLHSMHV